MIESHEAEESKDSLESTQKEEERPRSLTPPPARKSPEPNCAICLENLTNKSYTDSCFHTFCFTCLLEWSKIKPECPLCKKNFSSIVHNVRSFKDFDQYYVNKAKIVEDNRHTIRRFQYRTTMTADRFLDGNRLDLDSYLSHRMRYAPHSVNNFRVSYASSALLPSRRLPDVQRQRVYNENLWVIPQTSNRVRCITPEFFRQNIACTHRLTPWLHRELLAVMPNNENQITFVIELINALLIKYEIRSQEFRTLIEPYTASYTAHFVHELYNFAISPYETIESYDLHAEYDMLSMDSYDSADSDVIALPMDYSSSMQPSTSNESSRRKKQSHPRKKHSKGSKKLKKMILKKNSEKNVWESSFTPTPSVPFGNSSYTPNSLSFELPGPSTSRGIPFFPTPTQSEIDILNTVERIEVYSDDNDDIEVVDVLKPKSERTPEIVNLSSEDELSNFENEVIVENKETLPIISVVDDNDQASDDLTLILSDDECEILYFKELKSSPDASTTNKVIPDKPIDYSLKTVEKKYDIESDTPVAEACSSSNNVDFEQGISSNLNKILDDIKTKIEAVKPEKNSVIRSIVRAVTHEETGSSSLSPLKKRKKRKSRILDDVSTESCSDGAQVSEIDTSKGKLKLRSVVAHYAFEDSDESESTHHSRSHKKRKERKKKKKKRKHRRCIYSSDSD